jgi:hypothetical protein
MYVLDPVHVRLLYACGEDPIYTGGRNVTTNVHGKACSPASIIGGSYGDVDVVH